MSTKSIQKILVANRGEIALRIMRSAKEMGIKTVAIYSEIDLHSPHVRFADESVCVGPAPSSESYLNIDKIIEVAKALGIDAIHPGYGFLSENSRFAKMVTEAGIVFIGPSPKSIEIMGDKLAAKDAVKKFEIPMVPGTENAISDVKEATAIGQEIGYPILIKASAGGGGKGMRVVFREEDIEEEMNRAISEAESAFGDGSIFIEKYIESNKHIEIQVLGDQHGNIVHLFERECSVQRRHQKVVEEAPSPSLTPEIRKEMGDAAVKVAQSCNYFGAGTVEFIFDDKKNFYFLEMNTRLQVEHPVTEEITGFDLVKEQIKIAEGKALEYAQEDLSFRGHSIELRVYAEDPVNGFLPDIGTLETYQLPNGPGIRVDDGFEQGMEVPIYYDPMISKLIATGKTRDEAISRLTQAIDNYIIDGVQTTLDLGRFVINHPAFVDGSFDTKFIDTYFSEGAMNPVHTADSNDQMSASALAGYLVHNREVNKGVSIDQSTISKWKLRAR